MAKVNFMIAGVQKCGTTALYDYLRQFPEIYMSDQKEFHFFDNEAFDWNNPPYADYHALFAKATEAQLCGEATPIYTFWPSALERIARYNPDIKMILCLRPAADRAYSHWRMERTKGRESLTFSKAIRDGRARLVDNRAWRIFSYVERGFYAPQLSQLLAYFPKENIHIVNQIELLRDHNATLKAVCKFLEIPAVTLPPVFIRPLESDPTLPPLSETDRDYLDKIYVQDKREMEVLLNAIKPPA